jgi:hypothetical protein
VEKADLIGTVTAADAATSNGNVSEGIQEAFERLQYSNIDMEGEAGNVTLAYMTDDTAFVSVLGRVKLTGRDSPLRHSLDH